MQMAPQREAWLPLTPEDQILVRTALEAVLASPLFRGSRRYPAMLRYIVEKTLDGQQDSLKERMIGVEVFGRDPGYDTNEDPVVRFSAGEIRKRIAQFYQENGAQETGSRAAIEFHLPLGTYVPQFFRTSDLADTPSVTAALPLPPEPLPAPPLPQPSATLPTGRSIVRPLVAAAALIGAAVLLAWVIASRIHPRNPVVEVWAPLLNNPDPVLISAGRPVTPANEVNEPSDLTIKQRILRPEFRVSITTVDAITNIAGFLQLQKKPFRIHDADTNTLADLHGRPIVLVNGNDNKWTLLLLKPLRFRFVSEGDLSYVEDARQPGFHGWSVDFNQMYRRQTTDYAIVGRFKSATTGSPVIVVAGISSNGTEAAGEFIVSPDRLEELFRSAPAGWKDGNFEAVLKVEVVDGNTGASTVVAKEFW